MTPEEIYNKQDYVIPVYLKMEIKLSGITRDDPNDFWRK